MEDSLFYVSSSRDAIDSNFKSTNLFTVAKNKSFAIFFFTCENDGPLYAKCIVFDIFCLDLYDYELSLFTFGLKYISLLISRRFGRFIPRSFWGYMSIPVTPYVSPGLVVFFPVLMSWDI